MCTVPIDIRPCFMKLYLKGEKSKLAFYCNLKSVNLTVKANMCYHVMNKYYKNTLNEHLACAFSIFNCLTSLLISCMTWVTNRICWLSVFYLFQLVLVYVLSLFFLESKSFFLNTTFCSCVQNGLCALIAHFAIFYCRYLTRI